jgi:prepilin-type N-terminal cleavage/methylation domain-containing protein
MQAEASIANPAAPGSSTAKVRGSRDQAGFSLTEIMTTLALGAILALTTVAAFAPLMQSIGLHSIAQETVAQVQGARMRAIATNASHRITTAEGGRKLVLQRYNSMTGGWDDVTSVASWPSKTGDVTITVAGTVVFAPRGTAEAPALIRLIDGHGRSRTLEVSQSGSVRLR